MGYKENCLLCKSEAIRHKPEVGKAEFYFDCRTCGIWWFDDMTELALKGMSQEKRAMLSAYTREINEYSSTPPQLQSLTDEQIEEIIKKYKAKTVVEKLNNLIMYLERESHYIGKPLKIHSELDYPITYSEDRREFETIYDYGKELDLVRHPKPGQGNTELSLKGWERAEKIKQLGPHSRICFVAMSFKKDLEEIYKNGIEPAITEAGYKPNRVDLQEHNEKICDFIIKEIRASKFMVADATYYKHNVFFEAGFAYGLNLPVIWMCRQGTPIGRFFDTRQYYHIIWENAEELEKKLFSRIKATII